MAKELLIARPLPLFARLKLAAQCWLFKAFVYLALNAAYLLKAKKFKQTAATYSKNYGVRPTLANRVFIPSSFKPGTKLPLYINIHGGGFALCDPRIDDPFCHKLANNFGICVVSMNYRKAPVHPFPGLIEDATVIAKAILADPNLPVDHSKVAIGGFSAGGNIALSIAQIDGIREHVKAVVPIYPVVDFSGRYKGEFRKDHKGREDGLKRTSAMFNWAYLLAGQDLTDPLLSPIYASRDELPMKIFFVGAQWDYLCHEAGCMAKKLARIGESDEMESSEDWTKNGVKWKMVPDVRHGFTHVQLKGEEEVERKQKTDQLYEEIGGWLESQAYN